MLETLDLITVWGSVYKEGERMRGRKWMKSEEMKEYKEGWRKELAGS